MKKLRVRISSPKEKRGSFEGAIRIPLHASLFLFIDLAFLAIPCKSFGFLTLLFSIPTAPTNISFLNNRLQIVEGPRGAINVRRLAPATPNEQLCCWPFAMQSERPACRYSSSFEYLRVAEAPAAP